MADRISWIKNLLGSATPAERAMIDEAKNFTRATNNEKLLVGDAAGAGHLQDVLQAPGDATSAPLPKGYWKFLKGAGKAGADVSTAHAHPAGMAVPSEGDFYIWSNMNKVPGTGGDIGLFRSPRQLARQKMWIAGMRGPDDLTMMEPLPHVGSGTDFDKFRSLVDTSRKFDMNMKDPMIGGHFSHQFNDFTQSWKMLPEQRADAYDALSMAPLMRSFSEATPMHMDPATELMRNRPGFQAADVWPEWMKRLDAMGIDPAKAEGGQVEDTSFPLAYASQYFKEGGAVPGYELGGVPAVSLLGKNSIQWVKNLLGQGTSAEQAMVKNVRDHALLTGNEKLIVGPTTASDFSGHYATTGGHNFAPVPTGYHRFMDQWGAAGTPVSTAHSHPRGAATPSAGDMELWANDGLWPDGMNGLFKPTARQQMWIQAARSPTDTVMIPPIQGDPTTAYDTSRAIQKLYGDRALFRASPAKDEMDQHAVNFLAGHFDWNDLSHEQRNGLYNSVLKGYNLNRVAEQTPMMMDPAATMMRGNSSAQAGDLVPAFNKYLDDRGFKPYAEGGQVDDFPLAYASQYFDEGGQNNDDSSQRYSIPSGSFGLPRPPPPTFQVPIGKGEATVGGNYDMINKMLDAQLGYQHPVGSHGARLGAQGYYNKYIGEGSDQVKPNWGVGLRLNVPFAEGGQVDDFPLAYMSQYFDEGGQVPGYAGGGQKTVAQAIRAALAAFDKTPKTEGYVYHATNVPRLHDIADEGLQTHKPWEHTDQGAWPDGSTRKRAYFASSPEIASSFSPEAGSPALLRTQLRKGIERENTGDFYSYKPVPRDDLEFLHENGEWHPLKLWGELK